VAVEARAAGGDRWRLLLRKGEALSEYAKRRIRQALLESWAFTRTLLALRLAYLLELADALLSEDWRERLKLSVALGRILDDVEFFLYDDCFKWRWDDVARAPYSLHADLLGLCFREMGKLAGELEREGLREFAECYRRYAQLALIAGRAVELFNTVAQRAVSAGSTLAEHYVKWDEWGYRAFSDGSEWGRRVELELVGAAAREDLERLRKLLRRYAGELAQHVVLDFRPPFPIGFLFKQRLEERLFNPFLSVDAEAVKALEELRELRFPERMREVTEEMKRAVEELERRLSGKAEH
jgi:hypothetical protein